MKPNLSELENARRSMHVRLKDGHHQAVEAILDAPEVCGYEVSTPGGYLLCNKPKRWHGTEQGLILHRFDPVRVIRLDYEDKYEGVSF